MGLSRKAIRLFTGSGARFLALLVIVLGGAFGAFGQQITGTILGTVQDPQGAVVNSATVKATNVDTGFTRSASTNGYGEYRIDYLPVGRYTVEATAPSFERYVQKNIALDVEQELTVNIALAVGAATQTVTVTAAPPAINTADAVLGRTIEPDEILGLPLVNRNVYTELSLTPGIMANSSSDITNAAGTPNMTVGLPSEDVQVNGGLDSGNGTVGFYLDGGNNITGMRNYGNQAPNPDAIEEFRVETNAFQAQYGEFSAAVVTVVTKSGTNKFHGSLFEFNRNTDFNAFSWIPSTTTNPTTGAKTLAKSPYHRNQFRRNRRRPHPARQGLLLLQLCRPAPDSRSIGHRRFCAHGCRALRATLPRTRSRSTCRALRIHRQDSGGWNKHRPRLQSWRCTELHPLEPS